MSGTSVDAIDVAIVEISGTGFSLAVDVVGFSEVQYPQGVREEVLEVCNGTVAVGRVSQLNFLLGRLFGDAVLEACAACGLSARDLDLVGSHGQTIYHQAEPAAVDGYRVASTLQIGESAAIAAIVGKPVVSDFRTADVAAGGHGAPLVPFVDFLLFRDPRVNRVALNIGGIANLTAIPAAATSESVFAFDTGPGNMVIDLLVQRRSGGVQRCDRGGRVAARGRVDGQLLDDLLQHEYFGRRPPKSTGRELFGEAFANSLWERGLGYDSLVATATRLTSASILRAIERYVLPRMPVDELIVSGGGWRNPAIVEPIRVGLPETRVRSTAELGIDSDAKEAVAFALLAYESFQRRPANLPSATGAARPAVLGKIAFPSSSGDR